MNYIQKLQKIFHTDKKWGKFLLLISFYLLFFIFGYWIWFLPIFSGLENIDIQILNIILTLYFLFFLPIFSFLIVFKIRNNFCFKINKIFMFIINLIVILLNLFIFFTAILYSIKPNFF